jgi:hypothetical protein
MSLTDQQFNQEHAMLLNEKHQNTLKSIQQLQEVEKYMFQNLERLNNQGGDAIAEAEAIQKINDLTESRISLFNQLKDVYTSTQEELNDDRRVLANQIAMTKMVEGELNNIKGNISALKQNKNNKLRLVEIGEYESKRYNAHVDIMKIISIASVIVLGMSILHQQGISPAPVTTIVIILAMAVSAIMVILKVIDLYQRNNMNFDQYDFAGVNKAALQPGYQTVLQHDESFFKTLGQEVKGEYNKARKSFSQQLNDFTKAAKGAVASAEGGVQASSTKESLANMGSPY